MRSRSAFFNADVRSIIMVLIATFPRYEDPGMLVDDDGRVYMYSGCNSNGNISVVELDPQTWQEIGMRVPAVVPDYRHRGFEVGGDNNELLDTPPWVEGAWMNKLGGVYFLQYGAYAYNFAV